MPKRVENLKVIQNIRLNKDFFILELFSELKLPEMKPGQFAQVKIDGSPETFLRRPISIHDVNYSTNTFRLLIQIAGKGTQTLSYMNHGDALNLVYPLGNSFSLPDNGQRTLLVGGGCGIAPLLFLARYLKINGFIPDILLGFRNSERIIEFNEYSEIGEVYITTDDGSAGVKGFVNDHNILRDGKYDMIYCCGPEIMMKAIAKHSRRSGIRCEISLENLMACGFGVCLCCTVGTVNGNLCTCTDGPVFNINDLKW